MKTTSLFQLGGLAIVLAACLFAIGNILYLLSGQQPSTTPQLWIGILGSAFFVLGLGALYARQAPPSGVPGLIGYILLSWGHLASVGSEAVNLGLAHGVFSNDQLGQVPSYVYVGMILIWILVLGHILFGVAVYRAKVYPKYAGVLLVLVGLVQSLTGPLAFMRPVYIFLSFVVWAWLGWVLITGQRIVAAESVPTA
jgi:hypothetical protein